MGIIVALFSIGGLASSPVFGILTGHFNRHIVFMWLAPIGCMITMAWILLVDHQHIATVAILLFLFGFFSSAFLAVFSLLKENTPEQSTGTAMGFLNTLNELGPALLQPLFGLLLDRGWTGEIVNNTRIYSNENYHHASLALLVVLAIAFLIVCFIRTKKLTRSPCTL